MCTSFTYQIENGSNSLSRTMDFSFILDPGAVLIPRSYTWNAVPDRAGYESRYAFTGLSRKFEEYVFADGINERGLCCAVLYFPGYAAYSKFPADGMTNLAPYEVVFLLLSSFADIREVKNALQNLNIVDSVIEFLGITPPFHWIVTDKSGASIVIEPLESGIAVSDNPVGVMSNSPEFGWHMTNIRNFIGVSPQQRKPVSLNGVTFAPFSQGSGTFGLPGDYTPPARFLRVLFGKEAMPKVQNEQDAVTAAFHLLYSVDIPKGSVSTENGADYTQYSCCMICDSCTYYFKTYDNSQICRIDLLKEDLDAGDAKSWLIPREQQIKTINT